MLASAIQALKRSVPWQAKIVAKLLLARLPADYRNWQSLSLFRHGLMDDPRYAMGVFSSHFDAVSARLRAGFIAAELGPGDSLLTAVIAAAHGASRTYLIDAGDFASREVARYRAMADVLRRRGLTTPTLSGNSIDEILRECNASYLTRGLASLREIPDASVDFLFSHAVLEHVKRSEFASVASEMRRVLRKDGVVSHRVDLADHLGGGLNNLRFPGPIWESDVFFDSGFYTNRLRKSEILAMFLEAGFEIDAYSQQEWPQVPIDRSKLSRGFKHFGDDELRIKAFDVVLRPA
jgi:SAM-dependent methyltransferase